MNMMKHSVLFRVLVMTIAACALGAASAWAESGPGEDPVYDGLYYEFSVTMAADGPVAADYQTNYAQVAAPVGSGWTARVFRESGAVLASYEFDPVRMTAGATGFMLSIPYAPNAAEVAFVGPDGATAVTVSTRQSRLCDENRTCDAQFGEDADNCPLDCEEPFTPQTAAISDAASPAGALRSIATRILLALAGLGVLVAVVRVLDSTASKRDNPTA